MLVTCPICSREVDESKINVHIDQNCDSNANAPSSRKLVPQSTPTPRASGSKPKALASIFAKVPTNGVHQSEDCSNQTTLQESTEVDNSFRKRTGTDVTTAEPASKRLRTSNHTRIVAARAGGLSAADSPAAAPLAERLRPRTLSGFVGQRHLVGPDSLLMHLVRGGGNSSLILWGPPGCGKTTLARLLALEMNATFKELSATIAGINDVRDVFEEAKGTLKFTNRKTILFVDEIHRFTKAQQDIFLPYVEQGFIQLIGATTENPSFKINSALLSRCRLSDQELEDVITRALARVSAKGFPNGMPQNGFKDTPVPTEGGVSKAAVNLIETNYPSAPPPTLTSLLTPDLEPEASSSQPGVASAQEPRFPAFPQLTMRVMATIVSLSTGDARTALSLLELVLSSPQDATEDKLLDSLRRSVSTSYDRTGESRYDQISALHKSVRGSDGSAALYWLARMLVAGEDPLYIARRMIVCASEDIGLADDHALPLAMAAYQACEKVGMPECRINLAHCVAYLSECPKSTRSYNAYARAEEAAKRDMSLPVPLGVRNAPTRLMQELKYGETYRYNPDYAHPVWNEYVPVRVRQMGPFLLSENDECAEKRTDEGLLRDWEREMNGEQPWNGRAELGLRQHE